MISQRRFLAILFLVLLLSVQSIKGIHWWSFWGLDFQNLFAFHHCPADTNPYLTSGKVCGDALGRDLYYPPLMYWAFAWTRLFESFRLAYSIWFAGIVSILGLAAYFCGAESGALATGRWRLPVVAGTFLLVLFQYPSVFALERGNNDAWVVLIWTCSYLSWRRKAFFLSGALVSLTALLKVYPVFSVLVVGAGLLPLFGQDPKCFRKVLAGLVSGLILGVLVTWQSSWIYLTHSLPLFALKVNNPTYANHSVLPRFQSQPWAGYLICAGLLLSWLAASWKRLSHDPALVFAGAQAISTYFSNVSEDYNLLTTYPLLFLLLGRSLGLGGDRLIAASRWLTLIGFTAVFGHRQIFVGTSVYFQVGCWVAVAALTCFSDSFADARRKH